LPKIANAGFLLRTTAQKKKTLPFFYWQIISCVAPKKARTQAGFFFGGGAYPLMYNL
jgi:hypothetical protein